MIEYALMFTLYTQSILTGTITDTHRVVAVYETQEKCTKVLNSSAFADQISHIASMTPNVLLIEARCVELKKPEVSLRLR